MFFRRDIEPQCEYCRYGTAIGRGAVACVKRGVVSRYDSCGKFVYDPYARVPDRPRKLPAGGLGSVSIDLEEIDG